MNSMNGMNISSEMRLLRDHQSSLCHQWTETVLTHSEYIRSCNISISSYDSIDLWLRIQVVADQHQMNESEVVRLKMEFESDSYSKEKENALQSIGTSVSEMSGIETAVSVEAFTVTEIPRIGTLNQYYSWMKQPIWILPLMVCAMVLIIIVGVFHWNTKERMLDGSRVK